MTVASRSCLSVIDLAEVADARPESLPLGIKQRLQLAVAVLHRPAMLILDEPTSGVDPVARDGFWRTLIDLSRDDGVTIFISTHFMNEADRCDRISLMHAGKVLAIGTPEELVRKRGSASLEDAFISYLDGSSRDHARAKSSASRTERGTAIARSRHAQHASLRSWPVMGLRAARDDGAPARSDPADVCPLRAPHPDDRLRLRHFTRCRASALRRFRPGSDAREPRLDRGVFLKSAVLRGNSRLRSAAARNLTAGFVAVTFKSPSRSRPPSVATLRRGRVPDVAVWLDGSMPFRAETTKGYVTALSREISSCATGRRQP